MPVCVRCGYKGENREVSVVMGALDPGFGGGYANPHIWIK